MKNVEGIINRLEEEQRIESVSKKINLIISNKKNDIRSMRIEMKKILDEKSNLEQIITAI